MAILIGAIAYPLYYLWGAGKTEVISVLSIIGAISIVFGLSIIINIISGDSAVSNTLYYTSLILILIFSIVLFAVSYIISCTIFKKKEY